MTKTEEAYIVEQYLAGNSVSAIARRMGIPRSTVDSARARAGIPPKYRKSKPKLQTAPEAAQSGPAPAGAVQKDIEDFNEAHFLLSVIKKLERIDGRLSLLLAELGVGEEAKSAAPQK